MQDLMRMVILSITKLEENAELEEYTILQM
jgi:hypothetical protein